MKRFKLGFGNKTVLEQIAICRRVATGIAKLPAEHRRYMTGPPVADSVAEAGAAHAEVEVLKTALKATLAKRATKVSAMRDRTTSAASALMAATGGEPAALLAAGLGIVKNKQPVGVPGAPTRLRILSTDYMKAGCGCAGNGPSAAAPSASRRPPTARRGPAGSRRPSASNKPAT